MKKKFSFLCISFFLFLLSSCSSYINELHRDIDNETISNAPPGSDKFNLYRPSLPVAPPSNPFANRPIPSTANMREFSLQQKRRYDKKRAKGKDLLDEGESKSLWMGPREDHFLFSQVDKRKIHDIVIIQVQNKLKNEISNELRRFFPPPMPQMPEESVAAGEAKKEAPDKKPPASPAEKEGEVFDKLSGIIAEKMSGDYLLVRSKKEVLYHGQKHLLGIQALVAERDIDNEDSVPSDKIIESVITVLR